MWRFLAYSWTCEPAGWRPGSGRRSIFLINVPVGVVTLALVRRTVPPQARIRGTRLDVAGDMSDVFRTSLLPVMACCAATATLARLLPRR